MRSFLYALARLLGDLSAVSNPKKAPKRIRNKIVGRIVGPRIFRR